MKKKTKLSLKTTLFPIALVFATGVGMGYVTKDILSPTSDRHAPHAQLPLNPQAASVCFTPNKKCQAQILQEIAKAQKTILVQAYGFTDRDIAFALVQAKQRGIGVKVLLDKSNRRDKRSAKDILMQYDIPVRFDAPPGIAHNKLILIDEATIIGGSYNYSASAWKRNTENLLIIRNQTLMQVYRDNWRKRWEQSQSPSYNTFHR